MLPGKLGVGLPVAIPRQAVLGRQWGCLWMGSGSLLPGFPRPTLTATSGLCFGGGDGRGQGLGSSAACNAAFWKSRTSPPSLLL